MRTKEKDNGIVLLSLKLRFPVFFNGKGIYELDWDKGDWKTYLRKTVLDWQSHPNLTEEEWSKIKCPAFFINGENDPFGTCAELQEKVPNAKIYEVKGGGHHPHFVGEQIDEINAMMLEFLSDTDKK